MALAQWWCGECFLFPPATSAQTIGSVVFRPFHWVWLGLEERSYVVTNDLHFLHLTVTFCFKLSVQ